MGIDIIPMRVYNVNVIKKRTKGDGKVKIINVFGHKICVNDNFKAQVDGKETKVFFDLKEMGFYINLYGGRVYLN